LIKQSGRQTYKTRRLDLKGKTGKTCALGSFIFVHYPNIIKETKLMTIRLVRHITCTGRMRNEYESLISKAQGKRTYERPTQRQ